MGHYSIISYRRLKCTQNARPKMRMSNLTDLRWMYQYLYYKGNDHDLALTVGLLAVVV